MAGVIKSNPVSAEINFEQVGKTITWFNVTTTGVNISTSTGPDGAINALYQGIQKISTIIAAGAPTNASPSVMSFAVEGVFLAADIQTAVQELGTVDALDLSTSAVAVGLFVLA